MACNDGVVLCCVDDVFEKDDIQEIIDRCDRRAAFVGTRDSYWSSQIDY